MHQSVIKYTSLKHQYKMFCLNTDSGSISYIRETCKQGQMHTEMDDNECIHFILISQMLHNKTLILFSLCLFVFQPLEIHLFTWNSLIFDWHQLWSVRIPTSDSIFLKSPWPTPGSHLHPVRGYRDHSPCSCNSHRYCLVTPLWSRRACSWGSSDWQLSHRSQEAGGSCRRTDRRDSSG